MRWLYTVHRCYQGGFASVGRAREGTPASSAYRSEISEPCGRCIWRLRELRDPSGRLAVPSSTPPSCAVSSRRREAQHDERDDLMPLTTHLGREMDGAI